MKHDENQMAPHFQKAVAEIDQDLYKLRKEIDRLYVTRNTLVELYGGETEVPTLAALTAIPAPGVQTHGRKPTERKARKGKDAADNDGGGRQSAATPSTSLPAALNGKPDTVAGAMKLLAKEMKSFTKEEITARLMADLDYAMMLKNVSPTRVYGNLDYWTETGKLRKEGETYTYVQGL